MVAFAVVLGLVLGVYALGSTVFGSDGGKKVSPATPSTNTVVNDGVTPTTLAPTTTTEMPVKPRTVPTAQDPAEVVVMGDSDAGGFGPFVKQLLDKTGIVTTKVRYKLSTGLARPDYYDWPAHMRDVLPQDNPDIVVVSFGGNDAQALRNVDKTWAVAHAPGSTGRDDTDWKAEYGRRVGDVLDLLSGGNRFVIWVGIPNDNDPKMTGRLEVQDQVVRAEVAKRPGKVVFIDTWAMFSGPDGSWAKTVVDPRDGQAKAVRRADGFHLNEVGAQILALHIADAVKKELHARGATNV